MSTLTSFLAFATLASSQKTFPNIGFLGAGYDVFMGNPMPTSLPVDPGFRDSVFSMNGPGTVNPDGYTIPYGTQIDRCNACSFSFAGSSFTGVNSYQKSLEQSVTASGSFVGAHFSASVDYKQVSKSTSTKNHTFVQTNAKCSEYCAQVLTFTPPNMTNNFDAGLSTLDRALNSQTIGAYYTFINAFGTHVVTGLTMGSRYGQRYDFTSESYSTLLSSGLKVETAAGYAGAFSVNVATMTDVEKEKAQAFTSMTFDQQTFTTGSRPPQDGDVTSWAQISSTNPMPIRYTMDTMDAIIRRYAQNGENGAVADNMATVLDGYCKYLQGQNKLADCNPLPPDPDFPRPVKLCTNVTTVYGSDSAAPFDEQGPPEFQTTISSASKIILRSGKSVDSIQIILSNGVGQFVPLKAVGGTGGDPTEIETRHGLRIVGVNMWTGNRIDALQFIYSDGSVSQKYGGSGGSVHTVNFGPSGSLFGMTGQANTLLRRLGFYYTYICG